jgi:membrane protease YdiL (CAAX protease family)
VFPERARALFEVVLCSGFPTQIAVATLLQLAGFAPIAANGRLSGPFLFTVSMIDAALVLSLVVFFLRQSGESPLAVLFGRARVIREAGLGALTLPITLAIVAAIALGVRTYFPSLRNVPTNPLEALLEAPNGLALFLVVAIVAGGVREEVQRAFVLHRFEQSLGGAVFGVVVTSLLFGLGHTIQGWDAALITGTLGALWGTAYLWRRSATGPIVNHALFNTVELLGAAFVSR